MDAAGLSALLERAEATGWTVVSKGSMEGSQGGRAVEVTHSVKVTKGDIAADVFVFSYLKPESAQSTAKAQAKFYGAEAVALHTNHVIVTHAPGHREEAVALLKSLRP